MLDRSVPYYDVVMCLPGGTPPQPVPTLPEGYAYKAYEPADMAAWCEIEAAVGEFMSPTAAKEYFAREFAAHPAQLARRMALISSPGGEVVANASAWWRLDEARGRVSLLHWVAVRPSEQGKGLGRAVSLKALSLFTPEERKGDIWLTTQTWSHVAIDLYLKMGFRAHKTAIIAKHKNGFDGAARALAGVMRPKSYAWFMYTAID